MAVLVLLSVGTGYVFSVGATFFFKGDQFYEASAVLLVFVLLGHWLEMRARAGASRAIRALLDLAPHGRRSYGADRARASQTKERLMLAADAAARPGERKPHKVQSPAGT